MRVSKVKSYLGFAIKGNKVIFGYDKLFENKKNPKLVIICSSLNEKNTNKVQEFSDLTHALELTGYVLTPLGAALTIVGIPLYVKGNKIMQMDVKCSGNAAGLTLNF